MKCIVSIRRYLAFDPVVENKLMYPKLEAVARIQSVKATLNRTNDVSTWPEYLTDVCRYNLATLNYGAIAKYLEFRSEVSKKIYQRPSRLECPIRKMPWSFWTVRQNS